MKNIKVLLLVKDADGGTGTYINSIMSLSNFFNLHLLIINPPIYRKIRFKKTNIFSKKNPKNYYFSFYNINFFIQELIYVNKVIKMTNPDVILSIDVHSNVIAQLFKYIYNVKTILTTHIYLKKTIERKSTHVFNFFLKKTVTFLYSRADLLIGVSKGVSNSLKHDFLIKKPIVTVYHGIKTKKQELKFNKKNRIITVCRIDQQKDLPTLIKALKIVKKEIPSASLTILGDGPEKSDISRLINRINLTNSVKILSWKNNINSYLEKADLFVLSSHYEGFSYAILEAMNNGLPIISTDSPYGPSEIIKNNKFGILTPIGNPQQLAYQIIDLLKSKSKYGFYSRQSIARAQDFSINKMLQTYKRLISKTVL